MRLSQPSPSNLEVRHHHFRDFWVASPSSFKMVWRNRARGKLIIPSLFISTFFYSLIKKANELIQPFVFVTRSGFSTSTRLGGN